MELIRTPKDWHELAELIRDMRGTQADLSRVAIMAYQLGHSDGHKATVISLRSISCCDEMDNTLAHHELDKEAP